MDLMQLATQLGQTAGVVIVVVAFLRYLAGARKETRADRQMIVKVINHNTRAFARSVATNTQMRETLDRFVDRPERSATRANEQPPPRDPLSKLLCATHPAPRASP